MDADPKSKPSDEKPTARVSRLASELAVALREESERACRELSAVEVRVRCQLKPGQTGQEAAAPLHKKALRCATKPFSAADASMAPPMAPPLAPPMDPPAASAGVDTGTAHLPASTAESGG